MDPWKSLRFRETKRNRLFVFFRSTLLIKDSAMSAYKFNQILYESRSLFTFHLEDEWTFRLSRAGME